MNKTEKIKIKAIETDCGYFCQLDFPGRYSSSGHCLGALFFDGEKIKETHNKSWGKIDKKPQKIEIDKPQPNINYRYELIDKSLEGNKFPLVFLRENVSEPDPDSAYGEWVWKSEYSHLRSLYELKFDRQPPTRENVEFDFDIILKIDKIKEYGGFSYPIQTTDWSHEGFTLLTQDAVQHELIDTIIFPDIVLPARVSHLTSWQTYKVIRKHVQDNINPKYAVITSDYNFCFTVKKKIPLAKKVSYQKDISKWGAKKPKYVTDYRETREIEIFEMTYSGDGGNYKGYTPIEGFKGKNIEELKENIDNYLNKLMEIINRPVEDCPHCNGRGVFFDKINQI